MSQSGLMVGLPAGTYLQLRARVAPWLLLAAVLLGAPSGATATTASSSGRVAPWACPIRKQGRNPLSSVISFPIFFARYD